MSLYGFSNSGFNNTSSGVLNITDGLETEISNGNVSTVNIDGNNVYLDGSLSSIGSNTVNEFYGISITSTSANLDLSLCQGIKSTIEEIFYQLKYLVLKIEALICKVKSIH